MRAQILNVAATVLFSSSIAFTGMALAQSPVGERAHYDLDRNPARTTSMIRSGVVDVSVDAYVPGYKNGPSFESSLNYDFNIQMVGRKTGTEKVMVPAEYFSPEFMENLRATGSYTGPDFKIRHEGFLDARTIDGNLYPHCDNILIYDVNTFAANSELSAIFRIANDLITSAAQAALGVRGDVENLQVRAAIYEGVPVLGAVKLDVSGIVSGFSFKAGGDYKVGANE
ncbi:MAG: hypothetical protein RIQ81_1096 [Pseudomonadota bacterium]|jgi:hypothetical protein